MKNESKRITNINTNCTEKDRTMKLTILVALIALFLSGCLVKQTKTDPMGDVIEEKYIIKRPVKEVIENIEFE